jgi:fructuronate reductase
VSELRREHPAAPVRLVHLGLGNFFRAHQAWYTGRAPDTEDWGIAAFTGRTATLAHAMSAQDGLYTLVTRAGDGDRFEVISSVSRAHPATDHSAWLGYLASPEVRAVTITVTEAGYRRGAGGGLDADRPQVRADIDTLRADPAGPVQTAPAKLLAGLLARREAEAGALTIVPCDNLPDNGSVVARVIRDLAERVEPGMLPWLDGQVSTVTTMVDRITPAPTGDDLDTVAQATGVHDRAPVVTEPFSEWVLTGGFPAGRPRWEDAGATFANDIGPFEQRKLWLLNGGHSLLAYAASIRGHATVADAVADETCRAWLEQWWTEASRHLTLPADQVAAYRDALLDRFANPRIRHRLDQIAADGSQKVPIRILPTLRLERAQGGMPQGATRALAAWVCHLRGLGAPVTDAHAEQVVKVADGPLPSAVRAVLATLAPEVAADDEVVAAVLAAAEQLSRS